jgi:biotin carboxyl carrier protein
VPEDDNNSAANPQTVGAAQSEQPRPSDLQQKGVSNRAKIAILIVAVLFVIMPFLFWRSTWFGLPLSDRKMDEAFADPDYPRKIQHALSQLADRIIRGDASARRWYPQIIAAAAHRQPEIRLTAAWVMGQDNSVPEFRATLQGLLRDAHPLVRRNAALALVRFGDASGREEILAMLRPFALTSPAEGTLAQRLQIGDSVNPGTLVGRIRQEETVIEMRSTVPGTLERWLQENDAAVAAGTPLAEIAPSAETVWEALRALLLVGEPEDLPLVETFLAPREGWPAQVAAQARATARAIRERQSN